jgi:hypothetical protein
MSEAELHVLRARLRGGIENKARRGELKAPLPIGLVSDDEDRVVLEPDRRVRQTIERFFKTFEETGSAMATVKHFRQQGWKFPRKLRRGVHQGDIVWGELVHSRALQLLHNPRYAGAFFFGRSRQRKKGDGHVDFRRLPPDQWHTLLPDSHPGYITWDQYQRNVRQLSENAQSLGGDRRRSPAGEGPALLQGLAVCGLCGQRMTVRYDCRETTPVPRYMCQRHGIEQGQPLCQSIPGKHIDEAVGRLLLEKVTPLALEVTLKNAPPDVSEFRRSLAEERNRLDESLAKAGTSVSDTVRAAIAKIEGEDMVGQVQRSLQAADVDAAALQECEKRLLDLKAAIDKIDDALEWPLLVQGAEEELKETQRLVREYGESSDAARLRLLEVDLRRAMDLGDADLVRRGSEEVRDVGSRLLTQQPGFWVGFLEYLEPRQPLMRDSLLAEQLFVQGRRAINKGDVEGLKTAVRQLVSLLPSEEQQKASGYGGTTIL